MRKSLLLGLVLITGFTAGQVLSKDDPRGSPDEIMKAFERNGTPGAEHALLKKLEGRFECRTKATFEPGQPAKESVGTSEQKITFGGLFLQQNVVGTCPITGKSFQGVGYTGYDNAKKKYVAVWLDSLSSGIHPAEGTIDGAGKVITFNGTCTDPLSGKDEKYRSVLTIVDDNRSTYEIFNAGPDGKEFRAMEITYTKR